MCNYAPVNVIEMYIIARSSRKNLRTVNGKEINDQSRGDFRIGFALCKFSPYFAER